MHKPALSVSNARITSKHSRVYRAIRYAFTPIRKVARWYYYLPRGIRISLALVLLIGIATGSYFWVVHLQKRALSVKLMEASQSYDYAAQSFDTEGMKSSLDKILSLNPADESARKRKHALETGEADADDTQMASLLMHGYLKDNLPAAAREAQKIRAKYPKDWLVLLVLAQNALVSHHNPDEARQLLDTLPDPEDPQARLDANGLLLTLRLFDKIGKDGGQLRSVIVRRVLPMLKGGRAQNAPAAAKAQLIECYLEPFSNSSNLPDLASYWSVVARLADSAVADAIAADDVATLVQIGAFGLRMRGAQIMVARELQFTPEEANARGVEVDDRTRRVWDAARKLSPTRPEPYLGLAELALTRDRNSAEVEKILLDGLVTTTGDQNRLLTALTEILVKSGNPREAFRKTYEAAKAAATDPWKWYLVALAARTCQERGDAIKACEFALKQDPKHILARVCLAELWLELASPHKAMEQLLAVGEPVLRSNPRLARVYARTLVESGLMGKVPDLLSEIAQAAPRAAPPFLPAEFLRGVLDARSDGIPDDQLAERAKSVAQWANDILLKTWTTSSIVHRLRGDALYRLAEVGTPMWNPAVVKEALRDYESLPSVDKSGDDKSNPDVAAPLAALLLKGEHNPVSALRAAEPLRKPEAVNNRTPFHAEILAAVLIANGQADQAVELLKQFCLLPNATTTMSQSLSAAAKTLAADCYTLDRLRSPSATAGAWVQYALALDARGHRDRARAALDVVLEFLNRSSREHAEWNEAKLKLQ